MEAGFAEHNSGNSRRLGDAPRRACSKNRCPHAVVDRPAGVAAKVTAKVTVKVTAKVSDGRSETRPLDVAHIFPEIRSVNTGKIPAVGPSNMAVDAGAISGRAAGQAPVINTTPCSGRSCLRVWMHASPVPLTFPREK